MARSISMTEGCFGLRRCEFGCSFFPGNGGVALLRIGSLVVLLLSAWRDGGGDGDEEPLMLLGREA